MSLALKIDDPRAAHLPVWPWFKKLVEPHLVDARDAIVAQRILQDTLYALLGVALFVPGVFSWPLAALYLLLLFPRVGPHAIRVHLLSHRALFHRDHRALNNWLPWGLVFFYGIDPGGYMSHHLGMHHPEENIAPDTSSTLRYRRDSLASFGLYLLRFAVLGKLELAAYLYRKKKRKLLRRLILGEALHKSVILALLLLNWQAALVVVLLPHLLVRYGLMMGNWTEHAFIDQSDPGNAYKNSTTLINCPYNKLMFNDGYHCAHHIKAVTHWADLPGAFERDLGSYVKNNAVVFDGIRGFQVLWLLLMTRRYDVMARHLLPLGDIPEDLDARAAWLKARTVPA